MNLDDFFLIYSASYPRKMNVFDKFVYWSNWAKEWRKYFPIVPFEEKFRSALNSVTNNKEDDVKWKILMNECKNSILV